MQSDRLRERVVLKRTVVDNLKVIDVWTTSGRGKSHKKQVIASLRGASESLWQHFIIYNQHEENLINRLKHPCLKTGK